MGSGDSGCCSLAEVFNSFILLLFILLLSIVLSIFIVIIFFPRRSVQETQWEGTRGSWRSGSRTSLTGLSFVFNP